MGLDRAFCLELLPDYKILQAHPKRTPGPVSGQLFDSGLRTCSILPGVLFQNRLLLFMPIPAPSILKSPPSLQGKYICFEKTFQEILSAYLYSTGSSLHSQTVFSVVNEWSGLPTYMTALGCRSLLFQRILFYPQLIDTSFETSTWVGSLCFVSLRILFKLSSLVEFVKTPQ